MPVSLPPTATPSQLAALLPPVAVTLSLAEVRLLRRACLPVPVLTRQRAVALIAYYQRHKRAAYQAHRCRRLRLLADP